MVSRRQNWVKYNQEKIEMKKILEFYVLREGKKKLVLWYFIRVDTLPGRVEEEGEP